MNGNPGHGYSAAIAIFLVGAFFTWIGFEFGKASETILDGAYISYCDSAGQFCYLETAYGERGVPCKDDRFEFCSVSLLTPEIAELRWKEYERLHSLLSAAGFEDGTIQDSGLKPPPTLEELEEEAELRESIDQYIRETWNLEYE